MSNHEQPTPSHPKSDVRNTVGKDKQTPQGSARTTSAVDLEEFCEKHYEKLLPIMADKYEYEQRKKEKLEEVKARLDFGGTRKKSTRAQESAYSESRTMSPRRHRRSHSPRQSSSVFTRLKRERSRSPRHDHKNKTRRESTVFKRLGSRGRSVSAYSDSRQESSRYTENHSESEDSEGGTGGLSHESRSPASKMTTSPNLGEDPEDHLKIFQAAAKTERWAMPTWCHMFNSTLTGNARVWFDDLPPESINSYDDLREAFLKNYLQQKKCIRDPIVLHNIKQRDGESTEDFIQRYKSESGNVKGAPECMRISGFVHGITNPELIKRFHEKIPKTVDEMMQVATSFLQGQEAASNQERKKAPPAWKHQEGGHKQNFKKGGGFHSQYKQEKRPDRFPSHKNPKGDSGLRERKIPNPTSDDNPDECNHLRKQIEDMLKVGKLSYIITELKQSSGKDQQKKKGETSRKEKSQAILMIQSRKKVIRQKTTQSFSSNLEISFTSLRDDEGAEGPLIIEAEIGGHQVHRMCIDGGSSFEILYEHCFNRLRPEIKKSNGPSYNLANRVQRRNKMATGTNNTFGILTLRSSKIIPVKCAMVSEPEDQPIPFIKVKEERVKVAINPEHPEQTVMIGSNLTEKAIVKMCNLLQRSLYAEEKRSSGRKKHDDSWRMCVDFKDLNKACPKDGYPLPEIDWKVESLCGFPFKCFLDAYKGYHQIQMAEEDEEKIAPRVYVKRKVLADFIMERLEEEGQDDSTKEEEPLPARWTLFKNGSSCVDGYGAGVILTDPKGIEFANALRFQFETTNNEAEYEALIAGLRIAEKMGVRNLEVNVDSKLVANQVNETYIAKEADMIKYLEKVRTMTSTFRAFSIKQVPRSKNKKADALSKMASTSFAHLSKQVLVEELKEKSVNEREVLAMVEEEGDTWMTPIHEYLTDETLPAERKKARAIKRKSQRFAIINGILYM
ncbi:reverse transcriptase domain-containing protein [Tanacetum coccineum]